MKFVWKDIVKGLLVSMVISSIAGFQGKGAFVCLSVCLFLCIILH